MAFVKYVLGSGKFGKTAFLYTAQDALGYEWGI
jgi:hypothetical protein